MNPNFLMRGDCIKKLKTLPDESVDLIIVDPPYNIGVNYGKDKDKRKDYEDWCLKWLKESERVLKSNGSMYIINYPENNARIFGRLTKTNLRFNAWITWHYPSNTGMSPTNFTRSQRSILYLVKSHRYKFNLGEGEVLEDYIIMNIVKNTAKEKQKGFPNQIPVKLLKELISISSNKRDIVLDFFLGSGSTGVAARKLNRNFIGIELDADNFKIASRRINGGLE